MQEMWEDEMWRWLWLWREYDVVCDVLRDMDGDWIATAAYRERLWRTDKPQHWQVWQNRKLFLQQR